MAPTITIGDLSVNTDTQTVICGGEHIILTHTEYKILELLMEHHLDAPIPSQTELLDGKLLMAQLLEQYKEFLEIK